MFRWRYLIPRLVLLGAVTLALVYGLSPLCRWMLVTWGTRAVGAKVEVDALDVALWRAEVRLQNLRVADPEAPLTNLCEIAEATLDLDGDALLQRRLVVRAGRVTGLRFDTARQDSGAVEPEPPSAEGDNWLPPFDKDWLLAVAGRVREDWESNLQTMQLGQELLRRWPEEYQKLESRAEDVKARVQKLRDLAREAQQANPLRGVEIFRTATEQATAVRKELESLPGEVQRLRDQALRDRTAMLAAKDHDLQYIKQKLQLKSFDVQSLTRYLFDGEQANEISETIAWVRWARQLIPAQRQTGPAPRQRGRTVVFPGIPQMPKVLVEQLAVSGEALWRGQTLPFEGELTGLTTDPVRHGKPATLTVQTSGEHPLSLQATVDRTKAEAYDRLSIQCRQLAVPARSLGDRDALTVLISAAQADVSVELDLRGEALAGQMRVKQPQVHVQTALSPACGGEQLAARLNAAVSAIRSLEVAVDVSGTLSRPRWTVDSNLAPQLSAGIQSALRAELALRGQQAAQRVNAYLDSQLAKLDQLVAAKSQKLFGDREALLAEVDRTAKSLLSRAPLADRLPPASQLKDLPKSLQDRLNPVRNVPNPIRTVNGPSVNDLLRR
jgi:uncharacterized protein (TIGR03545 family)